MHFKLFTLVLLGLCVSLTFGRRRAKDPCDCMDVDDDGFGGIKKLGYELISCPNQGTSMAIGLLEEDGNKFLRVFVRRYEAKYEPLTKRTLKIVFYEGDEVMELEMSSDSKPSVQANAYNVLTEWKIDYPVTDEILTELSTRKMKAVQYMHYEEKTSGKIDDGSVEDINEMITCLLTPITAEK